MAVMQMQKFSICALKKDRNAILKTLQKTGAAEISKGLPEDEVFVREDASSQRSVYEKAALSADQAIAVLDEYVPAKSSMFAGKDLVMRSEYDRIKDTQDELSEKARAITALSKRIAEDHAESLKLDAQIESLVPWLGLDVPLNTEGTLKTALLVGAVPEEVSMEGIYAAIAEGAPESNADVNILSADKNQTCISVLTLKSTEKEVEDALRAKGFARISLVSHLTAQQQTESCRKKQEELEADVQKAIEEIKGYAGYRDDIKILSDYYTMRAARYDVLGSLLQSKSTVVIEGYIPASDCGVVKNLLEQQYDILFEHADVPEDEDMPVKLSNNAFSANFEGVVSDYSLPSRKEIDPTTIMSFFYVFLFGMMLSDAAYGAIMTIVCFAAIAKFPRMAPSLKRMMKLFGFCGISTIVWGVLFGGYFGDLIQTIGRVWMGNENAADWNFALWFQPLDDPMRLLLFCMVVGVIHLFTGLALKGYLLLRNKDIAGFFGDVVFWYCFLIGLILMLIPSTIFAGIAGQQIVFSDGLVKFSHILTIVGLVGIILMGDRSSKNPILRVGLGLYAVYGVTSWLSDVLSYSRLLALGLATGVIAQVFNQIGSMFGSGIIGTILFIIIFAVGTFLNMAINILGAYVHTNRLQYVEFFNKFYEGGGRPFNPFVAKTKYVDIKED